MTPQILVIGSGIAGLLFALKASRYARVAILTKKEIFEATTNYAQGGIAAPLDPSDSPEEHLQDTLRCGDGLCDESMARKIIHDAPSIIEELSFLGVPFTKRQNRFKKYDLGLEGGHGKRRIVHATDFTGRALESTLVDRIKKNFNISVLEHTLVLDVLLFKDRAAGVLALDSRSGSVRRHKASFVVLATGGAGKVYLYTTNPEISTGDGMAMAWRAGCRMANLEFVQFHPTCLYHPLLRNFLISEAVRGEGARLFNLKGERFVKRYDARGELAPRDAVARAIDAEMKRTGDEYTWLDIRHRPKKFLQERFPNIYKRLASVGIYMERDRIPVVPAAHYFCGGVLTDKAGRTGVKGLYAIGETACTYFHGANRLASNSLLEACAFARYAARDIEGEFDLGPRGQEKGKVPTVWGKRSLKGSDLNILIAHSWDEIRRLMADYVGIVRSRERLLRADRRLRVIEAEIGNWVRAYAPAHDLAELLNISQVARLIIASALKRPESRGLHYMLDFSQKNPRLAKPTVLGGR